jgi:hypothetical protein
MTGILAVNAIPAVKNLDGTLARWQRQSNQAAVLR